MQIRGNICEGAHEAMIDNAWEETYSSGRHINSWPWSDLISLYFRNRGEILSLKPKTPMSVLELGPGTGNNIPFWKSINTDYFAIEQSSAAIEFCLEKFPELVNNIWPGDFSIFPLKEGTFDLVCDRASITHGTTMDIRSSLSNTLRGLKAGGLFIGVDWFSTSHSDFALPASNIDSNTRSNFMSGQFVGLGKVHFSDQNHLLDLFKDFEILELNEKLVSKNYPKDNPHQFASWNIVARKRQ
jgi:SAM-dependent methyltransferase